MELKKIDWKFTWKFIQTIIFSNTRKTVENKTFLLVPYIMTVLKKILFRHQKQSFLLLYKITFLKFTIHFIPFVNLVSHFLPDWRWLFEVSYTFVAVTEMLLFPEFCERNLILSKLVSRTEGVYLSFLKTWTKSVESKCLVIASYCYFLNVTAVCKNNETFFQVTAETWYW